MIMYGYIAFICFSVWKQGGEMIPEAELPKVFNSVAARRIGLLGLSSVGE